MADSHTRISLNPGNDLVRVLFCGNRLRVTIGVPYQVMSDKGPIISCYDHPTIEVDPGAIGQVHALFFDHHAFRPKLNDAREVQGYNRVGEVAQCIAVPLQTSHHPWPHEDQDAPHCMLVAGQVFGARFAHFVFAARDRSRGSSRMTQCNLASAPRVDELPLGAELSMGPQATDPGTTQPDVTAEQSGRLFVAMNGTEFIILPLNNGRMGEQLSADSQLYKDAVSAFRRRYAERGAAEAATA